MNAVAERPVIDAINKANFHAANRNTNTRNTSARNTAAPVIVQPVKPAAPKKPVTAIERIFNEAFDRITREVPYDHRWSNGSGFYDFAVYGDHAPKVPSGSMFKSTSSTGRKLLLIGTKLGTVVVFQRSTGDMPGSPDVFCYNCTSNFEYGMWFDRKTLESEYEMEMMVGSSQTPHIGTRIHNLFSMVRRSTS